TGPGAGRPAKFYVRPRDREVSVQLPARGYDVAAEILAEGVEHAAGARRAAIEAAHDRGVALAADAQPGEGAGDGRAAMLALLEREGYEPFDDEGTVRLRNCPFHALVADHRDLTCSLNLALLDGAATTIERAGFRAVSEPREGLCCVAFVEDREG